MLNILAEQHLFLHWKAWVYIAYSIIHIALLAGTFDESKNPILVSKQQYLTLFSWPPINILTWSILSCISFLTLSSREHCTLNESEMPFCLCLEYSACLAHFAAWQSISLKLNAFLTLGMTIPILMGNKNSKYNSSGVNHWENVQRLWNVAKISSITDNICNFWTHNLGGFCGRSSLS